MLAFLLLFPTFSLPFASSLPRSLRLLFLPVSNFPPGPSDTCLHHSTGIVVKGGGTKPNKVPTVRSCLSIHGSFFRKHPRKHPWKHASPEAPREFPLWDALQWNQTWTNRWGGSQVPVLWIFLVLMSKLSSLRSLHWRWTVPQGFINLLDLEAFFCPKQFLGAFQGNGFDGTFLESFTVILSPKNNRTKRHPSWFSARHPREGTLSNTRQYFLNFPKFEICFSNWAEILFLKMTIHLMLQLLFTPPKYI